CSSDVCSSDLFPLHWFAVLSGVKTLSLSGFACFLLDSLNMAATEPFYLAAELEVAADLIVSQNTEAVNYCCRLADSLHHFVRVKTEICGVRDGQDNSLRSLERLVEVLFYSYLLELLLVAEELCLTLSFSRVCILLLELPPMFNIRVMYAYFCSHLCKLAYDYLRSAVA